MAANAEEFILKLSQQISGPATVAQGALAQLEGQIRAERGALAGLESALTGARAKLGALEAAGAASKAGAIEAQTVAAGDLAERLDYVRRQIAAIAAQGNGGDVGALAKLKTDAADLTGKLTEAKSKLAALESGGPKNASAIEAQRAKIAGLEGKVGDKSAGIGKLQMHLPNLQMKAGAGSAEEAAKGIKSAAGAAGEASPSLRQLGAAASETDGALGNIVRTIGKFKNAGAAGAILALVGVLIAVATAAIGAAIALTKFALASADAARSSKLMSNAAAGGAMVGAELEAVINDIASKSPLARDKIAEMARAMEVAKLRGRDMQNALEAATTAASAIGDGAASAFTSIAEKSQFARRFLLTKADLAGTGVEFAEVAASIAKAMGISVAAATTLIQRGGVSVAKGLEAMNAAVQAKFGKTVAAQMLSLNTQFAKMKEGFGRLFDGVDIEPFLRGLQTITRLFSEDTVTGQALKTLFVSIFNPLADASEGLFPLISAFLRGMVIAVLTAYVGFLQLKSAIQEAFGGSSASSIDWVVTAMNAGKYAVYALGIALFVIVAAVALIAAVMIPLMVFLSLPFIVAAAAVYGLIQAFNWITGPLNDAIVGGFTAAVAFLRGLDFAEIGMSLIRGLVNGIKSGATWVIEAVTNLGTSAMTALKGILGIHSPSTVFAMYGRYTAEGFEQGVEEGTPSANEQVKQLGAAQPSGGGRASARERATVIIENINFTGERKDFPEFRQMLLDVLEQVAFEGPEPVGP